MAPLRTVCVYCGSGFGGDPAFTAAAVTLGKALAEAGIGLVYGGGNVGLMGTVARAVIENGGHVTGIIPDFLKSRERMLDDIQETIVVQLLVPSIVLTNLPCWRKERFYQYQYNSSTTTKEEGQMDR